MISRFIALFALAISCLASAGAAIVSFILDSLGSVTAHLFRIDPTPRSIFETRRLGLA